MDTEDSLEVGAGIGVPQFQVLTSGVPLLRPESVQPPPLGGPRDGLHVFLVVVPVGGRRGRDGVVAGARPDGDARGAGAVPAAGALVPQVRREEQDAKQLRGKRRKSTSLPYVLHSYRHLIVMVLIWPTTPKQLLTATCT